MIENFDKILDHSLITTFVRDDDERYFVVFLGQLETPLEIRLTDNDLSRSFVTSHAIMTPILEQPYDPSGATAISAVEALRVAIDAFTVSYRQAVNAGHTPNEEWLIPKCKHGDDYLAFKMPPYLAAS